MELLVTGGAGYIGSVLTGRLLEEGHAVTVLDDLSTGHSWAVPPGARFVQGRVHDADRLLARRRFDGVFHLAASSLVAESVAEPAKYEENNVLGSRRLLAAMVRSESERIVFSSSAAVYGERSEQPIDEEAPPAPLNPYGRTKLAVDELLAKQARGARLGAVSLRYFNVAGSYGALGEEHAPETHLVPLVLRAALANGSVLVYGDDYPTADGTCIRDYVHVRDVADAHLLALAKAEPGSWRAFNLGNGAGFSVREVIRAARTVTGCALPEQVVGRRRGDPAVLVASARRAARELGWRPSRASLEEIVADAWTFEKMRAGRATAY